MSLKRVCLSLLFVAFAGFHGSAFAQCQFTAAEYHDWFNRNAYPDVGQTQLEVYPDSLNVLWTADITGPDRNFTTLQAWPFDQLVASSVATGAAKVLNKDTGALIGDVPLPPVAPGADVTYSYVWPTGTTTGILSRSVTIPPFSYESDLVKVDVSNATATNSLKLTGALGIVPRVGPGGDIFFSGNVLDFSDIFNPINESRVWHLTGDLVTVNTAVMNTLDPSISVANLSAITPQGMLLLTVGKLSGGSAFNVQIWMLDSGLNRTKVIDLGATTSNFTTITVRPDGSFLCVDPNGGVRYYDAAGNLLNTFLSSYDISYLRGNVDGTQFVATQIDPNGVAWNCIEFDLTGTILDQNQDCVYDLDASGIDRDDVGKLLRYDETSQEVICEDPNGTVLWRLDTSQNSSSRVAWYFDFCTDKLYISNGGRIWCLDAGGGSQTPIPTATPTPASPTPTPTTGSFGAEIDAQETPGIVGTDISVKVRAYSNRAVTDDYSFYAAVEVGGLFFTIPTFQEGVFPIATFPMAPGTDTGMLELLALNALEGPFTLNWYAMVADSQGGIGDGIAADTTVLP